MKGESAQDFSDEFRYLTHKPYICQDEYRIYEQADIFVDILNTMMPACHISSECRISRH